MLITTNNSKINILGTEYEVIYSDEKNEDYAGLTDFIKKTITIYDDAVNKAVTLKHEVIHAFLWESGIEFGYSFHIEDCVNWFAMQWDKINKVLIEKSENKIVDVLD